MNLLLVIIWVVLCLGSVRCTEQGNDSSAGSQLLADTVRFASYNVSMFREGADSLIRELSSDVPEHVQRVAAVIQHVRPDVLALMEFDYDSSGTSLKQFKERCLAVGQMGAKPIEYPFGYQVPSNTGVLGDVDLNGDGVVQRPEDAFGFGRHPGQYAFALLSKFPLLVEDIRSFQHFLWKEMPQPRWPVRKDSTSYYSEEARSVFRVSSKNHVDIPVRIGDRRVHVILAHPTPPVFDGAEDRNGLRNFDEIRLLRDYIEDAAYLQDDNGVRGGLDQGASFVIMGDLNADPYQGDSVEGAIGQLLTSPRINPDVAQGEQIPASAGAAAMERRPGRNGLLSHNTSMFGMRIDYVLPSDDLTAVSSGVFWPHPDEPAHDLVADGAASDHMLVWVDVVVAGDR